MDRSLAGHSPWVTKSWTRLSMHICIYIVPINSFLRGTAQPRDGKHGLYKVDESKFKCQLSHLLDVWSGGGFYLTTFSLNFLICQTGVTITLTSEGLWGLHWWLSGTGKELACQCRAHGFDPWSGKIPRAMEQRSPHITTTESYWGLCA